VESQYFLMDELSIVARSGWLELILKLVRLYFEYVDRAAALICESTRRWDASNVNMA
jgi:hypothetical protein